MTRKTSFCNRLLLSRPSLLVSAVVLSALCAIADVQVWTDLKGRTTKATLVGVSEDGDVAIFRKAGKSRLIPYAVDRLSVQERERISACDLPHYEKSGDDWVRVPAKRSSAKKIELSAKRRNPKLKFGVGRKSMFTMPNGDKAFVTGIEGLKFSDFSVRDSDKMLTFEDSRIVDAEKSSETHLDDYWCEQMTDCNLLVWTGWAKWTIGITNEDEFAELLLKNPSVCKHGIIDWTFANRGYAIDESTDGVVAWVHANGQEKAQALVGRVAHYILEANRLAYMQVDWQNRQGGHAVTCCGYVVKKGMNKDLLKPESLAGLFIINSDNDKKTGVGGRMAPNTVQLQQAWFDADKCAFFSAFPNGDLGKIRFFCFLRAYDNQLTRFLKRLDRKTRDK